MNEPTPSHGPESPSDSVRLQTLYVVNNLLRLMDKDGLDIDAILPQVLQTAMRELHCQSGSIMIVDDAGNLEHLWHIDNNDPTYPDRFIQRVLTDGIAAWVIRKQQSALIPNTLADTRWLPRSDHPSVNQPWSAICVPLLARQRAIGVITVTKPGTRQFTQNDVYLLQAIADLAAVTIANVRLTDDSRRRAAELTTLIAATLTVSANLQREEILGIVREQMVALTNVQQSIIWSYERQRQQLTPWAQDNTATATAVTEQDFPWFERVLIQRNWVQNRQDGQLTPSERAWMEQYQAKTILIVPLLGVQGTMGVAQLVDTETCRTFTDHEISLICTLAAQAVIALENAQLYERAQRQLRESSFLNQASAVINSTLDIQEIMEVLLDNTNKLLQVEALSIALLDEQKQELVYEVAVGAGSKEIVGMRLPMHEGIAGWVMQQGRPALVTDTSQDSRHSQSGDTRTGTKTRAIICAPLQAQGTVFGTLQAINPAMGSFTEDDLQLLVKLANLASSALNNARQFARTQAAEARYLGLFEDSIDPIILTDTAGRILEVNRIAGNFLGYTKEELRGMDIAMLHPEKPAFLASEIALQSIQEDAQVHINQVITRAGAIIPVEVYAKRLHTGGAEILQWIHHDISKQVELEEMRQELMAMLIHDLQNPLSNIITSLEMLGHELDALTNPTSMAILEIANRSSQRLRALIRSLLDISRLEDGNKLMDRSVLSPHQLIQEARLALLPVLQQRHIHLYVHTEENLPEVDVDADMMTRVLINLLDNALKFSEKEQSLTITAHRDKTNADFVLIRVADQGPGILPIHRELVFDMFYRIPGKSAGKGIGLGLAFCRLAVEAHGGRIWVDEAPGGGALFSFTLPVAAPQTHD